MSNASNARSMLSTWGALEEHLKRKSFRNSSKTASHEFRCCVLGAWYCCGHWWVLHSGVSVIVVERLARLSDLKLNIMLHLKSKNKALCLISPALEMHDLLSALLSFSLSVVMPCFTRLFLTLCQENQKGSYKVHWVLDQNVKSELHQSSA